MKKILILTLIAFSLALHLDAQNAPLDSLWDEFSKAKHDTMRCNIYLEIGDSFKIQNPDSAFYYYKVCVQLAESKKFNKILAKSFFRIGIIQYEKGSYNESKEYFLKSLKTAEELGEKKIMSSCYCNLGLLNNDLRNYNNAIEYFNKSLVIAEEIGDKKMISFVCLKIGSFYKKQRESPKALEYYQKALKNFEEVGDKRGISNCNNNIGIIYSKQGSYNIAVEYYLKAINISEKLGDKVNAAKYYNNIGGDYSDQGDYSKAIEYYNKSLIISEELDDKAGISHSCNKIGIIHKYQGEYDKALEYYLKALKNSEELGDSKIKATELEGKTIMAYCFLNIGNIMFYQGNYDKAIEYITKALKIKEELGDKLGLAYCYGNIAGVYIKQSKYNQALDNYKNNLELLQELGDKKGLAICYNNIGVIYKEQGYYDKAIDYYLKSLKIREEISDKNGIASTNRNIASLFISKADSVAKTESEKTKNLNNSLKYGLESIKIASEINALPLINDAANSLMTANKKLGNFKKALEYSDIFITTKDSLFKEEKTKALTEMETRYQTEKKQQEIEKQQLVIEKQEIDNHRQRNQRNFFIVGSFLLALLALVVLRGYHQKRQSNIIVTEKNALLEQANEEIAAQRDLVTEQKEHIEKIHEEVTSSIRYASRIQGAVLPAPTQMTELLGDHFVLFKPKDIVSGDFYWATRVKTHPQLFPKGREETAGVSKVLPLGEEIGGAELLIFCVADCTGHGVPGAFMSMLGVSFLNDIVHKEHVTTAAEVLNHLRDSVIAALKQKGEGGEQKDGMDMGLCVINTETKQMQFAGGYNPCWVVPNPEIPNPRIQDENEEEESEVIKLKPDKMPLAIHKHMEPYTNHNLQLYPGDQVYLMSDGFQDQFGGPQGKKFMVKNLRELVVANAHLPMEQQHEALEKALEEWENGAEQVDDVTIMGVRI